MKNLSSLCVERFLKNLFIKRLFSFLLLLLLAQYACNTTEPPDEKPPVEPDSTTQNFTFETYEFGDGGESSWLNDIWIFNENNIWAVGYIREPISNNLPVNIIRWNGSNWFGFGPQFNSSGIYGIWAIDSSNIFFAVGAVVRYKKGSFVEFDLSNLGFTQGQGVHKLWGSSENNIWGVGPNSTIVHYDGVRWSKIDFDEGWRFDAITGSEKTGIAYASATDQSFNTAIVELKDNSANIIYNSANTKEHLTSFSIQMLSDSLLYLADDKIWKYNIFSGTQQTLYNLSPTYGILRNSIYNKIDMYFFGDHLPSGEELVHYNGKRFTLIPFDDNRNDLIYGGAFAIKDLAIMVGQSNNKAYLVEVKRR